MGLYNGGAAFPRRRRRKHSLSCSKKIWQYHGYTFTL